MHPILKESRTVRATAARTRGNTVVDSGRRMGRVARCDGTGLIALHESFDATDSSPVN